MANNMLSLKLLELRQKRGLTQKQLCEELHISRTSYSYFENGRRTPDIDTLLHIAAYYAVSLDEIVTGTLPVADGSGIDIYDHDLGIALVRHLQAKHIPIEHVMNFSKLDFDFLSDYKNLPPDDQSEIKYLVNYKNRKNLSKNDVDSKSSV